MTSRELELAINESEFVLSRSGYTTVMDLAKLGKKAFFIPTPGQYEQEYLAKKFAEDKVAPYCTQDEFKASLLSNIKAFSGFQSYDEDVDFEKLFSLFKSK